MALERSLGVKLVVPGAPEFFSRRRKAAAAVIGFSAEGYSSLEVPSCTPTVIAVQALGGKTRTAHLFLDSAWTGVEKFRRG